MIIRNTPEASISLETKPFARRTTRPRPLHHGVLLPLVLAIAMGSAACERGSEDDADPATDAAPETVEADGSVATLSLATGDRAKVSLGDYEGATRFRIELEVHDRRRLDGQHTTRTLRLVGVDGRRLDTVAEAHPTRAHWVVFTVDADFLRPGLYMIEVDAVDDHALDMRRFVLDIAP